MHALTVQCPNPTCFGVPLVRRPKPRAPTQEARGTTPSDVAANVSKRRFGARQPAAQAETEALARPDLRKLCVICENQYLSPADAAAAAPAPVAGPSIPRKRSHDALEAEAALAVPSVAAKGKARARPAVVESARSVGGTAASAAVTSLEAALLALTGDLDARTSSSPRSPHEIAAVADAIASVARALSAVQATL